MSVAMRCVSFPFQGGRRRRRRRRRRLSCARTQEGRTGRAEERRKCRYSEQHWLFLKKEKKKKRKEKDKQKKRNIDATEQVTSVQWRISALRRRRPEWALMPRRVHSKTVQSSDEDGRGMKRCHRLATVPQEEAHLQEKRIQWKMVLRTATKLPRGMSR